MLWAVSTLFVLIHFFCPSTESLTSLTQPYRLELQKQFMPPTASFYKRKLPETCVAFSSRQGRKIFQSALANQGLKTFFPLIQQFTTQSEPAYCGLSTLVLVLNALSVDPRQHWKGPWRWYEESMLNCCLDLEDVKQTGITLRDFQCLALCQGLTVDVTYCDEQSTLDAFRQAVIESCVEHDEEADDDEPMDVLVVSYSRKVVGQTGGGHFSPLGAYDIDTDSVLILDTARFKYGAHWVKLPLVYEAMKPIDPDTGRSRGYTVLSFPTQNDDADDEEANLQPLSLLFRTRMSQHPARRKYKEYLASLDHEITWNQTADYWNKELPGSPTIWSISEPVCKPGCRTGCHDEPTKIFHDMRRLLTELVQTVDNVRCPLCNGVDHKTCVSAREALFVVYLASLSLARRSEIVFGAESNATKDTREQLLNEAALVATAIECSDKSSF